MSSRLQLFAGLIALQCSMTAGCANTEPATACTTNDDCPSHFCKADGLCAAAGDPDAGSTIDGALGDGSTGLCTPNRDGSIELAELPLAPGRMATFRTTTTGTFATAGTGTAGARIWDLSTQLTGDGDTVLVLASPAGTWWAADFPTATYAAPLAAGSDLLGVFHVDATALTLLGVVSPAAGATQTKLTYTPPAQLMKLPLASGATWTSTSTVTGTVSGVFGTYDETYDAHVDQTGTMKTPYGEFPVMRTATDLTRKLGLATLLTKRQFGWTAECFGGVAAVISKDNEAAAEFSAAAEIRRIAP
ncbi:MAG: hypothetical protein NT062_11525 [Proteobacteria bacterium]|nr:hypothetical protein [Pseudomonadota bacterium]